MQQEFRWPLGGGAVAYVSIVGGPADLDDVALIQEYLELWKTALGRETAEKVTNRDEFVTNGGEGDREIPD